MKIKRKLIKGVSGVLSTSILTASCTQYLPPEAYVYNNQTSDDSDLGRIIVPITINTRSEDVQYIRAIQKITTDIINSPQKAKEFNENPKFILSQYGYNGDIQLDDTMLKITMALADTDIYEAIKNKNYKLFIDQCLDKGIISSNTFLSKNFYADQIEAICQNENFKKFSNQLLANNGLRSASISDSDAVLSPILIAALVLAVGVAVTVVAVFWVTVALSYNDDSGNIEVIDVLTLRPGMENTYIAVDDYTEELVNTSISIINEASPAYFESHSEIETRNLLKINMINNM